MKCSGLNNRRYRHTLFSKIQREVIPNEMYVNLYQNYWWIANIYVILIILNLTNVRNDIERDQFNMSKIYAYCRISKKSQSIERQVRNCLAAFPDAIVLKEAFTGTKIYGRKEFNRLLKIVKAGDTIVFDSASRMSRSAAEAFEIYQKLFDAGVTLVFLKEHHIDTDVYKEAAAKQIADINTGDEDADELINGIMSQLNKYMVKLQEKQIYLAFEQAEKEVTDLRQRTREGIETARLNGKQIGQREGISYETKKGKAAKEIIRKHSASFGGSLSDPECIKQAGVSRNSFYKYKRQITAELEAEQ